VWARVSTYAFPVEADEVVRQFNQAVDAFVGQPGLVRVEVFVNPRNAAAMTITTWESEEAMAASEDDADRVRRHVALEVSGWIQRISEYELVRSEPSR
jgi:heme-degrading monooxygenase HmoA